MGRGFNIQTTVIFHYVISYTVKTLQAAAYTMGGRTQATAHRQR